MSNRIVHVFVELPDGALPEFTGRWRLSRVDGDVSRVDGDGWRMAVEAKFTAYRRPHTAWVDEAKVHITEEHTNGT